jgi:hypothetical protein
MTLAGIASSLKIRNIKISKMSKLLRMQEVSEKERLNAGRLFTHGILEDIRKDCAEER